MKTRWYRGLPYDADRPFDKEEGEGWLAQDVTLAGIEVPAGTRVYRDMDTDEVWLTLTMPTMLGSVELPAGSRVLMMAKPRAWWEWVFVVLWKIPMVIIWCLFIALPQLVLKGFPRRLPSSHPPGKKLALIAWPGEVMEVDGVEVGHNPGDRIFHYRDGTVRAWVDENT